MARWRGKRSRRRIRSRVVKKKKGKQTFKIVDKYWKIDLVLLNQKVCTTRACLRLKWNQLILLNKANWKKSGKSKRAYDTKLMKLIIKYCRNKGRWQTFNWEMFVAQAPKDVEKAVKEGISKIPVIGPIIGLGDKLTTTGKNTKYIIFGILGILIIGGVGFGAFKLNMIMKAKKTVGSLVRGVL